MLADIVIFLCIGVVAGTLAGLLGLGGGIIVVPSLFFVFLWHNFPQETIAQSAVSTSLAVMILTSISSLVTHHKYGFVDVSLFKKLIPGLLFGVLGGTLIAVTISTALLKAFFSVFLFILAVQMFFKSKRHKNVTSGKAPNQPISLKLPYFWSALFGGLSSLLGVGAGSTFVPYLHYNKVPFNRAIGTSSAVTCVTAIWATICYQVLGTFSISSSHNSSTSLIYWPAVFAIAVTSVFFAYFGARLSHKLEAHKLKKIFAIVLVIISISLLFAK